MIIHILEGAKGVGKSTKLAELQAKPTDRPTKFIHLDETTPNTIAYFKGLNEDPDVDYVLDRGWLSELVYSTVYDRDERFTIYDILSSGLLHIPTTIYYVPQEEVELLYRRISKRDKIELTDKQKRDVRHANALFELYAYFLHSASPSLIKVQKVTEQ